MKSANFDNIADAQLLSPTLMDAYLRAADEVSRLAVGWRTPKPTSVTYTNSGYIVPVGPGPRSAPGHAGRASRSSTTSRRTASTGPRALVRAHHYGGDVYGDVTPGEQVEISVDGERVALVEVDRWMYTGDPNGASQDVPPIFVRADRIGSPLRSSK